MPSKRISEFSQVVDPADVVLAGYDATRPVNDRNVRIAATLVGGGASMTHTEQLVTIPLFGEATFPLMLPPVGTPSDVLLLSLEIVSKTIDAATYYFLILTEDDDVVFDWRDNNSPISDFRFNMPGSLYFPYSLHGTNQLYIKIVPVGGYGDMQCGFQAVASILPSDGVYVTGYVPPPEYDGPLLSDVYVGPDLVHYPAAGWTGFAEPRQAMFAIADGGTMHVAGGIYYLPFGIANDSAVDQAVFSAHKFFGPNPSLDYTPGTHANHGATRFNAGITIIGNGSYSASPTIFNGRGGYGLDALHRYRLTTGKGFIYDRVGCTIQGIQFINCGGADLEADGEAAIYIESFDPLSTTNVTTVYKCAFDGNENGIFTGTMVSGSGADTRILVSYCDFGYVTSNAQARDGHDHDFYINCAEVTVDNCHFYGCDYGNCMKSRSPLMTVTNCFVVNTDGRFIDYPDGGLLTVSDTIFQNDPNCNANSFGYANEFDYNGIFNPTFTDCTLNLGRYQQMIWMGDPTAFFVFTGTTQNWYDDGRSPPDILPTRDNVTADPSAVTGLTLVPPPGILPMLADQPVPAPASYP